MAHGTSVRDALRIFGRDVSLYVVQSAFLRVGQFALLPVYLAVLRPEDFGVLALANIFGAFMTIFLGLGLDTAVLRFFYEWPPHERARRLGMIWLVAGSSALLVTVLFETVGRPLAGLLIRQVAYEPYLRLVLWTAFFSSFETIPLALLRCRQQVKVYALGTIGAFLFREVLKIYFLLALGRGALGVIEGGFYASAALAAAFTAWTLPQVRLSLIIENLGASLRFALGRLPGAFMEMLASITDRLVLEKFIPVGGLGSYEVARRFANVVRDLNTPLKAAWVPYAIRLAVEQKDARGVLSRMSSYYVAVLLSFALGVALVAGDLIGVFGGPSHASAAAYVPILAGLFFLDGVYALLGTTLYISKRTLEISVAAVFSFLTLIASSLMLVPSLKIPGALLALSIYRLVHGVTLFAIAHAYYPMRYEWRRIASMVALAIVLFAIGSSIRFGNIWLSLTAKTIMVAGFASVVAFLILDGRMALSILLQRRGTVERSLAPASVAGRSPE